MKEKTSPYFHPMIEHINFTWKRKKGHGYPFRGRDFKELKTMTRNFPEWQLMALFDVFMEHESEWVSESGHSINAFLACIPWLVDDATWKMRARGYEVKLAPIPKEIGDIVKKGVIGHE